jgi:hypothetical protein
MNAFLLQGTQVTVALYWYLTPTEQLKWIAKLSEANSTQQGNVTLY